MGGCGSSGTRNNVCGHTNGDLALTAKNKFINEALLGISNQLIYVQLLFSVSSLGISIAAKSISWSSHFFFYRDIILRNTWVKRGIINVYITRHVK